MSELAQILYGPQLLAEISQNVWEKRFEFTFDAKVPELIDLFIQVIQSKKKR